MTDASAPPPEPSAPQTPRAPGSGAPGPGARPAAAVFIVATVLIDALGFGIVLPVLPFLIQDLTGEGVAAAARWGGLATFVYAIMQFLCSPVIGGLSDRFGRRPVLLMSLAALAVDFVLMGLAHALWVFFIARVLSGIFAATYSTANAYIADITPAEQRAARFGWLGAAMGVGFIIGPALGGVLGELSPRAPFFAAAALAALNAAYGFFVVPESLAPEHRRPFSWARAHVFGSLGQLAKTEGLSTLVVVYFLASLSEFVYPAVWSYVAIGKFGWSSQEIGASVAYFGAVFAVSQAAVIPLVMPRLGARRAIWISTAVEVVSLIGLATAPNAAWVYVWLTTALISGLQGPALQKVITERVGPDAQGELQGGLSALTGVVLIIAPLMYTQVFAAFDEGVAGVRLPGAPFLVAAAISAAALGLFLTRKRRTPDADADKEPHAAE